MNILLRPIDLEDGADVRFMYETRFHPDVCKYLMNATPKGREGTPLFEDHERWLRANVPTKRIMFILMAEGERIGYCHAYDFIDKDTVEVGFVVHPDYQGKGHGKEAVVLLLKHLALMMPEKRVILYVRKDNVKAVGLYRKLGFIETSSDQTSFRFDWRKK